MGKRSFQCPAGCAPACHTARTGTASVSRARRGREGNFEKATAGQATPIAVETRGSHEPGHFHDHHRATVVDEVGSNEAASGAQRTGEGCRTEQWKGRGGRGRGAKNGQQWRKWQGRLRGVAESVCVCPWLRVAAAVGVGAAAASSVRKRIAVRAEDIPKGQGRQRGQPHALLFWSTRPKHSLHRRSACSRFGWRME